MEFSSVTDKHFGETCYIIGKGPSLKQLKELGPGPVIALNESISYIETLDLTNMVYSLQQDGKPECMVRPKDAILLLSQRSKQWFPDYPQRIAYSQVKDLNIQDKIISAVSAIEFARKFGCTKVVFVAFDAITSNESVYFDSKLFVDKANSLKRFRRFGEIIKLSLKGMPGEFLGSDITVESSDYTAITLTGDRHLPFKLCRKWMLRQTVLPSQWIVVDDGRSPLKWPEYAGAEYHYRRRKQSDPDHTIKQNMLVALKNIKYDRVVIFEDDDWYSESYCEEILEHLAGKELVGQRGAFYYHWPRAKILDIGSEDHCALFKTAFRKSVVPLIQEICETTKGPLIDIPLWARQEEGRLLIDRYPPIAIGMKGLTGRPGSTSGWNANRKGYALDEDNKKLTTLIGDDVDTYKENFPTTPLKPARRISKDQEAYETLEDDRYSWLYKDGPYGKQDISVPRISKFVSWAKRICDLPNLRILDLGCGRGELATLLPHRTYTGVDVSTYAIEENIIENNSPKVQFLRGSIDNLQFEEMSFDLSICCDVLEHIPENRVDRVLKEIFRVASAVMLTIDCAPARLSGRDGKNLHCTVKSLDWWKDKIQKLSVIRYEDYHNKKVTFYCGSGYKSQGAFPDQVHGVRIRRHSDGSVWISRGNVEVEKYMDTHYLRDKNSLRWHYPIPEPQSIEHLKGLYKDKTCYILGKGPSLDNLEDVDIERGCPVLAINQSIHKAEECGIQDLFVIQQDTGINCRPTYGILLLYYYIKRLYPDIPKRFVFTDKDFGLHKHGLTVIVAMAAAQFMGCNKIVMVAFDACTNKNTDYAKCIGHAPVRTSSGDKSRFLGHRARIEAQAGDTELVWLE